MGVVWFGLVECWLELGGVRVWCCEVRGWLGAWGVTRGMIGMRVFCRQRVWVGLGWPWEGVGMALHYPMLVEAHLLCTPRYSGAVGANGNLLLPKPA